MNSENKINITNRLLNFINTLPVTKPKAVIYTAAVMVGIAMFGLFQLKINTGADSLIPPDSPEVIKDKELRKKYNCGDKFIVVLETTNPEGIFNYSSFLLLTMISYDIKQIKEITPDDVISLTTIRDHQIQTKLGDFPLAIDFVPLKDSLNKLQKELYQMQMANGSLVSLDGGWGADYTRWKPTAMAVIVETHGTTDRNAVYAKIKAAIKDKENIENKIYIMGAPVAESELGFSILKDLAGLIPLSIIVMALIFYYYFRNWNVVLLPLTEIAGCLIFVFGMIGYTGIPIYLPLTIMPVIIISLALPDVVHIFNHYTYLLLKHPDENLTVLVGQTMSNLYRRLIFTSINTAVGFSSFMFSGIDSVRYFGLFTSLGLLFCLAWSLLVIPAQIIITKAIPSKKISATKNFTTSIINFSFFGLKYKWQVISVFTLLTVLACYCVTRVYVQDSWESCFSKNSTFAQNNNKTNALFNGTHTLLISFETDSLNRKLFSEELPANRKDYLLLPSILNEQAKFESFLQNLYHQNEGRVMSFTDQMADMNFLLNHKQESFRHVGYTVEENEKILTYYKLIMGQKQLNESIDSTRQHSLIQFFIKRPDYKSVPLLLEKIRNYENTELKPKGIRIAFGGDVMQAQTMIREIVDTQISSLLLSISTILILLFICFRSFRYGLIGIISPIFAILLLFAIMGLLSIPLGVATSMFASILVGLGVDFSIHLIECYREYYQQSNNKELAIKEALTETGPAFLLDAIVISFSFGLMLFSQVPANTRLGLAIVIGYLACFGITMILLPALLVISNNRFSFLKKKV